MNALILGGMSSRHKAWVRQAAELLQPHFQEVRFLDYAHWDIEGAEMDVESELQRAAELAVNLGEYVVVAKSIGTVLATLGNARGLLLPKQGVFLGFPYNVVVKDLPEVADALPPLPFTSFVHNEFDPLGHALTVKQYVFEHRPERYEFSIVLDNNTHDYTDFAGIAARALQKE